MAEDEGTTMLETPPYFLVIVFVFFLVVTLGFEKILHLIRHRLEKKGKHGLVAAMNGMTNELMLMGLATLILLLFQKDINKICVQSTRYVGKTWLDHVDGCACCLANTRGVSPCYYHAKGCVSEETVGECCQDVHSKYRFCDNIDANPSRRLLELALGGKPGKRPITILAAEPGEMQDIQCDGRVQVGWGTCHHSPNSRPAVGQLAMHQVHLFIFLMAILHIFCGIVLILLSSWRVSRWGRWTEIDDRHAHMVRTRLSMGTAQPAASLELVDLKEKMAGTDVEVDATAPVPKDAGTTSVHPRRLDVDHAKPWRGRRLELRGWMLPMECLWCVIRQFQPNLVWHSEFSLMRAAFYYTHRINLDTAPGFDFIHYMRQSLEDDFSEVVGLGLPMWVFLIVFILLSSEIGWCIWVFIIIAGAILLVVNTKLVLITRYVTRGGCIHTLEPGIFWLNRPWLLLKVIKFLLFLCGFVYSNAIFFAAEFGRKSCFFSRTGFQGIQIVPWWALMLVNTVYFLVLSLNTMPLYSLVVQMGGDYKHALLPRELQGHMALVAREREEARTPRRGLSRLVSRALPRESHPALIAHGSLNSHEAAHHA